MATDAPVGRVGDAGPDPGEGQLHEDRAGHQHGHQRQVDADVVGEVAQEAVGAPRVTAEDRRRAVQRLARYTHRPNHNK